MLPIYKSKKTRTNSYSEKQKDNYLTLYSKKYESLILIQYDNENDKKNQELKPENPLSKKDLESLIKKIEDQFEEIDNKKIISLEERVRKIKDEKYVHPDGYKNPEREDNIIYYPEFLKNKEKFDKESLNRDPKSGATVVYVPQSSLPSGPGYKVLGMYVPSTHTIYISQDLPEHQKRFVYHHEVAHALGMKDETMADNYAAQQVGYYLGRNAA